MNDQILNNTANAVEAVTRGFQPIPLVTGQKRSRVSGWQKLRWTNTPEGLEEVRTRFDEWSADGHGGIGVLCGEPSGGLIDVDLDHPMAVRLADHFLPYTPMRSGRPGRPNTHRWYVAAPGTLQETRTYALPQEREEASNRMLVEYRSTKAQTALPGSLHPDGGPYTWGGDAWGGDRGPLEVNGRELALQVALLGFCSVLSEYWAGAGQRHAAYLALAGGLLRVGDSVHPFWERNAAAVIGPIADATNDEDGADQRLTETLDTTIRRLHEGKTVAGFGKLAEILGEDVVRQARVILAEIESLANLPSRASGNLSIEKIEAAVRGIDAETPRSAPSIPAPHAPRTGGTVDEEDDWDDGEEDAEAPLPPQASNDPLENRDGSWDEVDLEPYLTGQVETVKPSMMLRDDGQALLYPGRLNMIYGSSESAKSWISMFVCTQAMASGQRVVYIDFEDEPVNALSRMTLLGNTPDTLRRLFTYIRPEDPLAAMQRSRWGDDASTEEGARMEANFWDLVNAKDPALIIADGMTVLYSLHGLDTNDSSQTDTITSWLKRLTRNGRSTVVVIDHTSKNPVRGTLPIGSQHKEAMVQGTMLQAFPVSRPMPGAVGEVELLTLKDRPGHVRAASVPSGEKAQLTARVIMDSTEPGKTKMVLRRPDEASGDGGSPGQVKVDLRAAEAAAKAEQQRRDEQNILAIFGGDAERYLSTARIAGTYYKTTEPTAAEKRGVKAVLARLELQNWVMRRGSTRNTEWCLSFEEVPLEVVEDETPAPGPTAETDPDLAPPAF